MQFMYNIDSGNKILEIKDDDYKYLIKARRHKIGDKIAFRNFLNNNLYHYVISDIGKKNAFVNLENYEEKILKAEKKLHLVWAIIDPKIVEKYISCLNEIGVEKITFVYAKYSQKNFKINFKKIEKILISSSMQCGRSDIIKLDFCETLEKFLNDNNDVYFLDFSEKIIENEKNNISTLVIGCEGGFSNEERKLFIKDKAVGFKSNLILRSQTAIISASAKIII